MDKPMTVAERVIVSVLRWALIVFFMLTSHAIAVHLDRIATALEAPGACDE